MRNRKFVIPTIILIVLSILSCLSETGSGLDTPGEITSPDVLIELDRESKIPKNAVKGTAENDIHPPQLHSTEFEEPVPIPGEVNTAGAEDSPFITIDGNTLYFFFTPDVNVPYDKQVIDGVSGIYVSHKLDDEWDLPERVILQEYGKLALDGCEFILNGVMYFCSAREGLAGVNWFTAVNQNGIWGNWQLMKFNPNYQVGELHITSDGKELYFASERSGGKGNRDIWHSHLQDGVWLDPANVAVVNTEKEEGWPAISPDGSELWFTRDNSIWRSNKLNDKWQEPEVIVSSLAGEATIDGDGNLYFVHHFFEDDHMIEADIYVSYRK